MSDYGPRIEICPPPGSQLPARPASRGPSASDSGWILMPLVIATTTLSMFDLYQLVALFAGGR